MSVEYLREILDNFRRNYQIIDSSIIKLFIFACGDLVKLAQRANNTILLEDYGPSDLGAAPPAAAEPSAFTEFIEACYILKNISDYSFIGTRIQYAADDAEVETAFAQAYAAAIGEGKTPEQALALAQAYAAAIGEGKTPEQALALTQAYAAAIGEGQDARAGAGVRSGHRGGQDARAGAGVRSGHRGGRVARAGAGVCKSGHSGKCSVTGLCG